MCHEDKVTTISETERKSLHSILIINTKCDIINKKVQLIIWLAITIVKRYAMSEDNNIAANDTKISSDNASETYSKIRNSIIAAQKRIYTAVNSAMVQAYWEIGEQIYIACGENDRA